MQELIQEAGEILDDYIDEHGTNSAVHLAIGYLIGKGITFKEAEVVIGKYYKERYRLERTKSGELLSVNFS